MIIYVEMPVSRIIRKVTIIEANQTKLPHMVLFVQLIMNTYFSVDVFEEILRCP